MCADKTETSWLVCFFFMKKCGNFFVLKIFLCGGNWNVPKTSTSNNKSKLGGRLCVFKGFKGEGVLYSSEEGFSEYDTLVDWSYNSQNFLKRVFLCKSEANREEGGMCECVGVGGLSHV